MEKLVPKLRFPEFEGNWEKPKLSEKMEIFRGASPRPKGDPKYYGGNIPRLMIEDVTRDGKYAFPKIDFLTEEGAKKSRFLKKGNVVLSCSGTRVAIPGILGVDACIHDGWLGFRNYKDIENEFLFYLFEKLHQKMQGEATTGGVFNNLTTSIVRDLKLGFPSLSEQQKIASFLTSVDERLTLLAQQKEKLELYKKGVMQQIFSQKLRFKDENGKEYPDWEEKKLGDICKLQGGFAFKSNEFKETGIPVIRISNISNHTNHIDLNSIVFYNKIEKDENFTIKKGDLIIAMSGATTGKSSIYNLEYYAYLNQRVGLFKSLTNKLEYNFLIQFVFSDLFKKQLDSLLVAGAQPNISSKDIESLFIPFPVIEEQKKIASFLSAIDVQIEGVSKKIEQTKMFKKGLLQQMFV